MTFTVKKFRGILLAMITAVLLIGVHQTAWAKTVDAKLSADTVKVGRQVSVSVKTDGVTFSSSDSTVACVNAQGVITGKKAGNVTISVKRKGYTTCKLALTVKKTKYKPNIPVAADEVSLVSKEMSRDENGEYIFSAKIKNNAKSGTIRKVVYCFRIHEPIETQIVTLAAIAIPAGETSEMVSCQGDVSGDVAEMELVSISIYAGKALYQYDAVNKAGTLTWGVEDTTAPVFSGWIEGESKYNGCVLRVCYEDRKDTYDFLDNVSAVDDRDGEVDITVDDSRINWKKEGVYKVIYTAEDKAGNVAKTWTKVQVYKKGTAEEIADDILSSITKSSWSDVKKARAIYTYIGKRCRYVNHASHGDWREMAVNGIRYRSGDCYTYYSMSRLLLTRAGIPNIMIRRYPNTIGNHFWNLAYVKGGWYHFDTCPRSRKGYFCLQTDAQLRMYSTGDTFSFDESLYPKRATKVISRNPI